MRKDFRNLAFYAALVSILSLSLGFAASNEPTTALANGNNNDTDMTLREMVPVITGVEYLEAFLVASGESESPEAPTDETPEATSPDKDYDPNDRSAELDGLENATQSYVVTTDYLNVRHKPNATSTILDVLTKGWVVNIESIDENGWFWLEDGGFINGKYTDFVEGSEAAELLAKQKVAPKPKPVFQKPRVSSVKPDKVASVKSTPTTSTDNKTVQTSAPVTTAQATAVSSSSGDTDLLARLVRAEAQGEPYEGKVAVALVVLNRVQSSKFPNSIQGVIYQKGQFSPVSNGSIGRPATETSRRAAEEALRIAHTSNDGSLFFYNPETATSRWLDGRPTVKQIGNHVFKN